MTDDIFDQLAEVNTQAETDPTVLRLSLDAKAAVKIGPFSRGATTTLDKCGQPFVRSLVVPTDNSNECCPHLSKISLGGKSRVPTQACDHDFQPKTTLTPYGIFLPQLDELFLYFTVSKVTSDFIADSLESWWKSNRNRFSHVQTLLINQDNGPENHSRRTQFMKRMVEFASQYQLNLRLAYYPPYHSKYNPIERTWGVLENHWNGNILDDITTVLNFAQTMSWKGKHPVVKLVTQTYQTGVRLTKQAMAEVENQIQRLSNLGRLFVDIFFSPI